MTLLTIRQSGGANIVSIPKSILKVLGLHPGSPLDLSIEDHKIILTPIPEQQPSLAALLQGSPKERLTLTMADKEWINEEAAGKEEI
ncbi:MAG TPA: AbrB/MazE/SpoVT family DNA-binding domain-containing protein [Gammaproteobacteria bacterium]|nr:AbrB/MazE/SpoVT family DNA-binding domain-containing protein [Gammaproteobacteria bacterium]